MAVGKFLLQMTNLLCSPARLRPSRKINKKTKWQKMERNPFVYLVSLRTGKGNIFEYDFLNVVSEAIREVGHWFAELTFLIESLLESPKSPPGVRGYSILKPIETFDHQIPPWVLSGICVRYQII